MKKIILSAAALSILFTACKKDENKNDNTFKIGNESFKASTVMANGPLMVATSGTNMLSINFGSAAPATGGTFSIVEPGIMPSGNQLTFTVLSINGTDTINYIPSGQATANVTIEGSKIAVSFTDVPSIKLGTTQNITISANIKQN